MTPSTLMPLTDAPTWSGSVPRTWDIRRLKYAAPLVNTRTDADGLPYVGLEHVESWTGRLTDWPGEASPQGTTAVFQPGDVLLGKLRPYLAKVYAADFSGRCSPELLVLRPIAVESEFLRYFLLTDEFIRRVDATTYGAKMPRANWADIGAMLAPVPPREEQRAIADYLDEKTAAIDALIAKRERHVELLEERHLATVSTLVTSGLDASAPVRQTGIPWLGEVPVHWVIADLKRVLSSADYGISDSLGGEGEVPVLRMGNIRRGEVVMDDLKFVADVGDAMLLRPLDLLFNRTNSLDLVGRVGIFRGSEFERVTFASYLVRFRTTPEVDPQYLCYLLNTPAVLEMARAMALPAIGQANLSPSRYGYLRICIPPLEEQRAIVEVIARRRAAVRASQAVIQRQIEKLREYRQTLVSAAVTGQLPVREEVPA